MAALDYDSKCVITDVATNQSNFNLVMGSQRGHISFFTRSSNL